MRSGLVVAALIFVLIVGFAFGSYAVFKHSGREVTRDVDHLMAAVQAGDWDKAAGHARELRKSWLKAEKIWGPLTDHNEIDHLGEAVERTLKLVELKKKDEALTEAAVVRWLAHHVPEREVPGLGNIF